MVGDGLKKNQIYAELRERIVRGAYKAGERFPGENQLASELGVSRVTLRAALELLEKDRLIERIDRKGTFVSHELAARNYLAVVSVNDSLSNPYQYIIPGIERRLNAAGHRLSCCSQEFIRSLSPEAFRRQLKQNAVCGIFFLENNFNGTEAELRLMKEAGLPVVVPHGAPEDRSHYDFPLFLPDFRRAFGDGVRHLASLGHTRIGTISYYVDNIGSNCRSFTREEYLEFLQCNGLEAIPGLFLPTEFEPEAIRRNVRRMMLGPTPPSAIACFSDFYAIHVYEALHELGIRIPEQVSVMGFCGFPGGQFLSPPLATVDLMYENIGERAAEFMLRSPEWFGNIGKPLTVFTPHRIVPGESILPLESPVHCMINIGA